MLASALLLLAGTASAAVFGARPANSTVGVAGEPFVLKWGDDGEKPTLKEMGRTEIELCVGSRANHVVVQKVASVDDMEATVNATFTPDASLGEDGQYYFFKYTATAQVNGTAFVDYSARFFIKGMKGDFNAQAEAAVSGLSTAPWPTSTGAPGAMTHGSAASSASSPAASQAAGGAASAMGLSGLAVAAAVGAAALL